MTDAPATPDFCEKAARKRILAAAILVSALGFIDGSVVSIATPTMRSELGATLVQAQWFSNTYLLPLSALILVGGAAGDRFGAAWVIQMGLAIFMAASILSALAPTAELLIAGRALKGIGAALMVPGSLALIARAYPPDQRGAAIGTWAAASAITTALGPILGGLLLSTGGSGMWRAIFAVNLPLGLVAIAILRSSVEEDRAVTQNALDWQGAVLATLALGLGAWALTDPTTAIAPILGIAAIVIGVAFVWRERSAAHPMMPLAMFRSRIFSAANVGTFCLYFALSALLFFLPMTVISTWGVSEAAAALTFAPLSVFIGLLSARIGRWADTVGPGLPIAIGASLVALALAGMALTLPLRAFWAAVVPLASLMGLGMAFVVSPLSTAVMAAVPNTQSGAASGVNNAVSRVAGLIAIAAMGPLAAAMYSAAGGSESFAATSDEAAHVAATTAGFGAILWVATGMSALAAVVAWIGIRPDDTAPGDTHATSHAPKREAPQRAPETRATSR
ncbi:MAG: MFS transporter [Pseudomonadota bacterium]